MAVQSAKNLMSVLIGSNANSPIALASVQITDPTASATYIADGQILMLGANDAVVQPGQTVSDHPMIRFVQRSGSTASTAKLKYSARIAGKDILNVQGTNYSAPVEQISTVGYNGSSGSLDATGSEQIITFVGLWDDTMWSEQPYRKAYDHYDASNTQLKIAKDISQKMNFDQFKALSFSGTGRFFSVVCLSDGTAASPSTAATAKVVNGSDVVTLNAADTGIQTVGTELRLGNTSTSATGRGTTVPVYIVTGIPSTDASLTSTQVRIHTYFQGTSDAALDLTADAGVVTGSSNYGLKISGLVLTWGIPPYSDFKFQKVRFRIELKGFGASTSGTPTVASLGNGSGEMVSEFEYFASGYDGALNRVEIPLANGYRDAVQATTYDTIFVRSADRQRLSAITGTVPMEVETFMFTPASASQNVILLSQINPYINSLGLPSISIV